MMYCINASHIFHFFETSRWNMILSEHHLLDSVFDLSEMIIIYAIKTLAVHFIG